MTHSRLWLPLLLALLLALGAQSCACTGDDEEADKPSEGSPAPDETPQPPRPDEEAKAPSPPAEKPAAAIASTEDPDATPFESRIARLHRLAQGELQDGFRVQVLTMSLGEGTSKSPYGRKEKGIQLSLSGAITNDTGKTLSDGFLSGALVLRFGGDTVKVQLSPDGLKPSVSPDKPWRSGTARLFKVDTYVFPTLLLEYAPQLTEARLFAHFSDPVDFSFKAPIWKADLDWLIARGAPVKGKARVLKAEGLRVGPKGKARGKAQAAEEVTLLYQKGDSFRVMAQDGEGWLSQKNLLIEDITGLYTDAKPQSPSNTASDDFLSFEVKQLRTTPEIPPGVKVKDGERFLLVDLSLTNKGDKDIKCSSFFVDFGPKEQLGPHKATALLDGALTCDKDKLPPGESASGTLAFLRSRHQLPFSLGYASPSKDYLLAPLYTPAETTPWTR